MSAKAWIRHSLCIEINSSSSSKIVVKKIEKDVAASERQVYTFSHFVMHSQESFFEERIQFHHNLIYRIT